jgi:hypothetical protein
VTNNWASCKQEVTKKIGKEERGQLEEIVRNKDRGDLRKGWLDYINRILKIGIICPLFYFLNGLHWLFIIDLLGDQ